MDQIKDNEKNFKVGDLIYVKKNKNNYYDIKQLPTVNGAIVVMDPYTGRVLALSGGLVLKRVNLTGLPKL